MRVLTLAPYYSPGYRAGGPIRSLTNLVEQLGGDHEFFVMTSDRDLGDTQAYEGLPPKTWHDIGKAHVYYTPPGILDPAQGLVEQSRSLRPDLIYFNGLFHSRFTLIPLMLRRLGYLSKTPVLVAPRGELSPGALSLKRWKKKPVLTAAKLFRCFDRIAWHATSPEEANDIRRTIGPSAPVYVAPNLSDARATTAERVPKLPGHLRLVFLSRITPKKNLLWAIERLMEVGGPVTLDIWGPREDQAYWKRCEAAIAGSPSGVEICWRGELSPSEVSKALSNYDALFLPTLGENFGHVIAESLTAGCPLLISDRTPWKDLEKQGVGWDIPLELPRQFDDAIQSLRLCGEDTHADMRSKAQLLAKNRADGVEQQMRQLLVKAAA